MYKKQDLEKIEGIKFNKSSKTEEQVNAYGEKAPVQIVKPTTKKGTVKVRSLRIRKDHKTQSEMVGGLVEGDEVTIHETFVDGDDTWVRIGDDQWAAMIYNGETYIQVEE